MFNGSNVELTFTNYLKLVQKVEFNFKMAF
jgi:hypothetical protein